MTGNKLLPLDQFVPVTENDLIDTLYVEETFCSEEEYRSACSAWANYFGNSPKRSVIEMEKRISGILRHQVNFPEIPERKEGPWKVELSQRSHLAIADEFWFTERTHLAMFTLHECVEMTSRKLGGIPVLRGTRFSVGQLISELADSGAVTEIADDFELNKEHIQQFLHALAVFLSKPVV